MTAEQARDILDKVNANSATEEERSEITKSMLPLLRTKATMDTVKIECLEASRDVLGELISLSKSVQEFQPIMSGVIKEFRDFRMTVGSEVAQSMAAFRDVRKFFMSDTHSEEIRRLREFVELCERLKALKDSGFLDSVADTILKL